MLTHDRTPDARVVGKILIVEYDRAVREMLLRWLVAAGQACRVVADVTEAEATLNVDSFDLVITDVCTPGYRDFDFLLKLQAKLVDLPILVLTDCKDPRYASKALTFGAWGYLVKPIQLKELLSQVNRVLKRSSAVRPVPNGHDAELVSQPISAARFSSEPSPA